MTAPETTPYGERLRERTSPLQPDDAVYDYAHTILCESIGRIFLQLQQAFDPENDVPPVASLLDAELCPDWALPWLGQFVGVVLPLGITPDAARVLIGEVGGWSRGTPAAIRAAAGAFLTGGRTVFFNERLSNSAYALGVVTLESETPNPTQTLAAITAQVPAGVVIDYAAVPGQTYQAVRTEFDSYAGVKAEYPSYDELKIRLP